MLELFQAVGVSVRNAEMCTHGETTLSLIKSESADEGTTWTVIEKTKRVSFNMYKGRKQIDIREYYKDGDVEKPGKKGIALSMSCYEKIKSCANNVATWI